MAALPHALITKLPAQRWSLASFRSKRELLVGTSCQRRQSLRPFARAYFRGKEERAEPRGDSTRNQVQSAGDAQGLRISMPLAEAVQETLDFGTRSILIMPSPPGVTLKVCVIALKFIP